MKAKFKLDKSGVLTEITIPKADLLKIINKNSEAKLEVFNKKINLLSELVKENRKLSDNNFSLYKEKLVASNLKIDNLFSSLEKGIEFKIV